MRSNPFYILSPVDRWCPRHIISSFPCHRVARPGRRLATKTTATATSQNKSVKVPHRQPTKKRHSMPINTLYREYSSARSSSLSLTLLHHIVLPDWSSMPNDCTAKWFSTVLNVGQSLNCHMKKKEKRSKNQRGNVWQPSSKDCDRSSTLCLFLFFSFYLFDPFPDRISVSEGGNCCQGVARFPILGRFFPCQGWWAQRERHDHASSVSTYYLCHAAGLPHPILTAQCNTEKKRNCKKKKRRRIYWCCPVRDRTKANGTARSKEKTLVTTICPPRVFTPSPAGINTGNIIRRKIQISLALVRSPWQRWRHLSSSSSSSAVNVQ